MIREHLRGREVVTMAYKRYNTIANAGTRICGNILVGTRYTVTLGFKKCESKRPRDPKGFWYEFIGVHQRLVAWMFDSYKLLSLDNL